MENVFETRNKILNIIKIKGPSLPMQIAKQIEKNSIITSAFLSELYSEKEIKISSMKVGGSPLYFLPGQEVMLEKFSQYLPQKEREALFSLQKNKLLKDEEQEPAIRVALRNLKDFAFPLALKQQDKHILFWYYLTLGEQEAKSRIEELVIKPVIKGITKPATSIKQPVVQTSERKISKKPKIEKQKPLIQIKEKVAKIKPEKPKSDFVNKIISFLQQQDIELLQELSIKKKEFSGIARINTDLGKLSLLCIAKDKKSLTENDLKLALQNAQAQKMSCLIISPAELNKKAQAYLKEHENLIKILKL